MVTNRRDVMRFTVEFKLIKHLSTSDLVQMCNIRLRSVLVLPIGQLSPCPLSSLTPPPHVVPVASVPSGEESRGRLCAAVAQRGAGVRKTNEAGI